MLSVSYFTNHESRFTDNESRFTDNESRIKMEQFTIDTGGQISKILLGESIENFVNYIPKAKKTIIVTDANIIKHYSKCFSQFPVIEISMGEDNKTLSTVDYIMERLVELEADRTTYIVGIGGGIVCDVTGFAASIYMRGLRFGFVSTTLLSMVDASVGGKNGVNHRGYKNMVGTFNQPEFVICDYMLLLTLDRQEYLGGFGEIIKHAAIKDAAMFDYMEQNSNKALNYDFEVIHQLIRDSIVIKSRVVEQDEKESGERKKLNFGHTFAHSLEKHTNLSHGQAVAVGMVYASRMSANIGLISNADADRIKKLVTAYQLPCESSIDSKTLFDGMKKDKKREGDGVHLILLQKIGEAIIKSLTYNQLEEAIDDLHCTK